MWKLRDIYSINHYILTFICLEKAMAPHSSTLAWKIPWTEEPGGLQYMGSRRVGHDWATSLSLFTFMHWRRKWQPTPVFLPGESQGWRSLVGCHLRGCTESDTTDVTWQQQQQLLCARRCARLWRYKSNKSYHTIFGLKDSATITVQFEHCKDSSMDEMCWDYIGKRINSKLDKERHLKDEAEPSFMNWY